MFVSTGFVLLLYYFAPRLHYDDDDFRVITFASVITGGLFDHIRLHIAVFTRLFS